MRKIILYIAGILIFTSCGSYQKLLKSTDAEEKLAAAKNFFLEKKYVKSATLFLDVAQTYKNTKQGEEVFYLLSESYMGQKDYYSASEYYKQYLKAYPRGEYAKESRYMIGYCYYLDSPDARLDQSTTHQAIDALTEYVQIYPESEKTAEAYSLIAELQDKLAYKGYLNAKLYLNLGTYLGNNLRAAVIEADNILKEFPETKHREILSFLILQAKYHEAALSAAEKRKERFSEVIDEYYKYATEFPNTKHSSEAARMLKEAKRYTK
ncbi:MAG: outer membrane protein assembly factor BamD [Prevotellaceae bacterium]|jgi:outer membrane protein assembly factor BamD|nr:outer membrane protein assembly factor BamD [Prevotellaceae bacterium]